MDGTRGSPYPFLMGKQSQRKCQPRDRAPRNGASTSTSAAFFAVYLSLSRHPPERQLKQRPATSSQFPALRVWASHPTQANPLQLPKLTACELLRASPSTMAWYDEDSWLTWALAPSPMAILVTVAFALLMPILLHTFLYRKAASATGLPTFLLVGPSGAGKTAFTMLVSC
jgi:hypothetical protein